MITAMSALLILPLAAILIGLARWARHDTFHPVPPHREWFD
jgi:hypothetical protein